MKETGLIFSGPMVGAIREGRKAQTRRIVSKRNSFCQCPFDWHDLESPQTFVDRSGGGSWYLHAPISNSPPGHDKTAIMRIFCRFAPPGEWEEEPNRAEGYVPPATRIWVRETFCAWSGVLPNDVDGAEYYQTEGPLHDELHYDITYRADSQPPMPVRWRPSIHMPRWASRIMLEVTGVRVERLQEISEEDAIAEGAFDASEDDKQQAARLAAAEGRESVGAIDYFRQVWNSLHAGKGHGWDTNPWVWVIEFRRLEAPHD